jgi:hypothetical protein
MHGTTFSLTVRRLLADRREVAAAAPRMQPQADASRRRNRSAMATRQSVEAFRRAQGAAYWHHDRTG